MQLAHLTAAIANGGNLYVPHAPRTPEENVELQTILRRKLDFSSEDRLRMLSGMIGAVNFGTAKLAYDRYATSCRQDRQLPPIMTSSDSSPRFSSINNPKLVVTVITTGSSEAGKRAAEVAGRVYRSIFSQVPA
jgi:cell division protein FtsI/penicillin-binding protein 2